MAISFYYGDTLVPVEEIKEKAALGAFLKFNNSIYKGEDPDLLFINGKVSANKINDNSDKNRPRRQPIGLGKPLSIEILCFYTGDAPNRLFGGKKDLLIVSGIKSSVTHDESPRAINQLVKKVEDYQHIQPSAFSQGSPVIYYTSAIDVGTILCSVEMIADTFNETTFENISNLFGKVVNIPIFFTSNFYLLAGSSILKMIGGLGHALFESKPFLKADFPLNFESPDQPYAYAGAAIIHNEKDQSVFKDYAPGIVDNNGKYKNVLINKYTKKEYKGGSPYILISIDGRNRDHELGDFIPKISTASILEKFYGAHSTEAQSTKIIEEAIMLYNDLNYYRKATKIKNELKKMDSASEAFKIKSEIFNAYRANIKTDEFKNMD